VLSSWLWFAGSVPSTATRSASMKSQISSHIIFTNRVPTDKIVLPYTHQRPSWLVLVDGGGGGGGPPKLNNNRAHNSASETAFAPSQRQYSYDMSGERSQVLDSDPTTARAQRNPFLERGVRCRDLHPVMNQLSDGRPKPYQPRLCGVVDPLDQMIPERTLAEFSRRSIAPPPTKKNPKPF
jgi:hypothetical protein